MTGKTDRAGGQIVVGVDGTATGLLPFGQRDMPGGERLVGDLAEQVADDVEPWLCLLLLVCARNRSVSSGVQKPITERPAQRQDGVG